MFFKLQLQKGESVAESWRTPREIRERLATHLIRIARPTTFVIDREVRITFRGFAGQSPKDLRAAVESALRRGPVREGGYRSLRFGDASMPEVVATLPAQAGHRTPNTILTGYGSNQRRTSGTSRIKA